MEPQIKFVTSPDGARLAYTMEGTGPALVVVPPYPTHQGMTRGILPLVGLVDDLAKHFSWVSYDMRGTGLSDRSRSDFSVDSDVRDLEAVIDHLKLNRVILFGFFRGGPVSLAYAVKHPRRVTHLILFDSFARGSRMASAGLRTQMLSLERRESLASLSHDWWPIAARALASAGMPGADPATIDIFARFNIEACTGEMFSRFMQSNWEIDVTSILPRVKVPTLVLHRRGDQVCPFDAGRELAAMIPGARFVTLEGNDHLPYMGDTGAILRALTDFVGIASPAASVFQAKALQPASSPVLGAATGDALALVSGLDLVSLSRYRVTGNFSRYEEDVRHRLKDVRQKIVDGFLLTGRRRENYIIWASPGSGKTYLVQEIADSLKDKVCYHELNLAASGEAEFTSSLGRLEKETKPCLCLIDEIDARPRESWPYGALLPYLDASVIRGAPYVFVMAGSSGAGMAEMKEWIATRPKGADLLSRIPTGNEYEIPPLTVGDKALVVLNQFRQAGKEAGHDIRSVEKIGLYYVVLNPRLNSARQLREFAVRAVERVPASEDRVKYDHLFGAGDPENKEFWMKTGAATKELGNRFVAVED